jgi:hypothetical protein
MVRDEEVVGRRHRDEDDGIRNQDRKADPESGSEKGK